MTEKRFDYGSFILGMFIGFIVLFLIIWLGVYGHDFWNQYKELICGFVMGFVIMYGIHKIDWDVGF